MNSVAVRIAAIVTFLGISACDSDLRPGDGSIPTAQMQSRLSSDWVKTILGDDGTLYTWGPGSEGTLGLGDLEWHDTPQKIPDIEGVLSYVQGFGTAFAIDADGDLHFWGNNSSSSVASPVVVVPTVVAHLEGARSIDYGAELAIHFVREDGTVGRVVHDPTAPTATLSPDEIPLTKEVSQISSTLGLYSDGTLFSLYDTEQEYGGLVPGLAGIAAVQNIFARRTVYLKHDGTVWAWGQNGCGELGNGSYASSATPVQVASLEGIVQISANFDFNLARREDGTVWFWGFRGKNEGGESVCQNLPVQVTGIGEAVDIYAAGESLIETRTGEYFVFKVEDYSVEPVPLP